MDVNSFVAKRIHIPKDLRSLTTIGSEDHPQQVDMTTTQRDAIWQSVETIYRSGTQPAISLCVRRCGSVVLDRAIGHARGNGPQDTPDAAKVLATPQTIFCMFSASKAVTAMVLHLLQERGVLQLNDKVAKYIPAFGVNGKDTITLRDLLIHRAGIPRVPGSNKDPEMLLSPERVLDALCRAKAQRTKATAYHAISGGYLLGEAVKQATGKTLRDMIHELILHPLHFNTMNYGVSNDRVESVARNYDTGFSIPFPASRLTSRALGATWKQVISLSNDRRFLTGIFPSANIMTTANEASRFYQLLLQDGKLDGIRIFEPETIRCARRGTGLVIDRSLLSPLRYGEGFVLGDRWVGPYGPGTAQAFGHPGFLGVLCWADPQRQLAVSLMTTGKAILSSQWWGIVKLLLSLAKLSPT